MLPVVRLAFVEAWNRSQSKWVLWNHRDTTEPTNYGSMNQQLKLRTSNTSPTGPFTPSVVPSPRLLIERRGLAHASRYLGDTADVLARIYLKPTQESERQAVAAVMEIVTD